MSPVWDPDFTTRSLMFEPLRPVAARLNARDWPVPEDMRRFVARFGRPIVTGGGVPLTFVAQSARAQGADDGYETRIYRRGEVEVRPSNWHDLLNALVWLTYPRAKAALNARHYRALTEQRATGARNRGPVQDALTLFDEGGVIVASPDADLLGCIERFAWKELFWHSRARVARCMRFFLFGHALYEKALAPFSGVTGRALLFEIGADLLAASPEAQVEALDGMVAQRLDDPNRLRSPRDLAPLPVLGVPGWCAANETADYYDDARYFRSGRSA